MLETVDRGDLVKIVRVLEAPIDASNPARNRAFPIFGKYNAL